jgi:hypothetical protein
MKPRLRDLSAWLVQPESSLGSGCPGPALETSPRKLEIGRIGGKVREGEVVLNRKWAQITLPVSESITQSAWIMQSIHGDSHGSRMSMTAPPWAPYLWQSILLMIPQIPSETSYHSILAHCCSETS